MDSIASGSVSGTINGVNGGRIDKDKRIEKRFECMRCGSKFTQKVVLVNHLMKKKDCLLIDNNNNLPNRLDILRGLDPRKAALFESANGPIHRCTVCDAYETHSRHSLSVHRITCRQNQVEKRVDTIEKRMDKMDRIIMEYQKAYFLSEDKNMNREDTECRQLSMSESVECQELSANTTEDSINYFGHEDIILDDTSLLCDTLIEHLIEHLIRMDLGAFISTVHFDQRRPKNKNIRQIRLSSDSTNIIQVYHLENKTWTVIEQDQDQDQAVDEIIFNAYRIANKYFIRNRRNTERMAQRITEMDLDNVDIDDIKEWLENVYDEEHVRKTYREDVYRRIQAEGGFELGRG